MRVTLDQQPTITLPNGQTFRAIVRCTAEERTEGMQNRSSLSPDEVMLFIHPETTKRGREPRRRHIYHMRNVVMSLDMVRLDEYGCVTWIETAPAHSAKRFDDVGVVPAAFMIEARAGWALANNLRMGNRVLIRLP